VRPFHCTEVGLTPAIIPNADNSGAQFLLKSMVMQIGDVYKFWKLSKMDALVWLATFLTVVFVSIEIGLLTGVVMSLATIFVLSLKPHTCLLGSVPHTDLYMNIERYKGVSVAPKRVEEFVKGEIPGC
jgi:MFS superfamily sulfate permease-like transporter